jgi:hypothetical protein
MVPDSTPKRDFDQTPRHHAVAWSTLLLLAVGCRQERIVEPVGVPNDTFGPLTIAVAPAINVSGASDLDTNRIADLMASELGYVEFVNVVPVSRVLAVLADQERRRIESPAHALEVARILGADAILVFSVTEYDPYDPPVVGISAQLYGRTRYSVARFNPFQESRRPAPRPDAQFVSPSDPIAQTQRSFNAAHEWVSLEIQRFAELRDAEKRPLGWRQYVADQQAYVRFCCHKTLESLMSSGTPKIADAES